MRQSPALLSLLACAAFVGCAERHDDKARAGDQPPAEAPPAAKPAAAKAAAKPAGHATAGPSAIEAIARLASGNARFAAGRRTLSANSLDDQDERSATAGGQHPFAAVLTCADSRLPPELIFDQSLGGIFVVRNAGNVAEPVGEGSLEYAVEHLGIRLIVVMGHSACGAVSAAARAEDRLPGHLADIQAQMPSVRPTAEEARKAGSDPIVAAVRRNAQDQAIALLRESPVLSGAVGLTVVPAIYDLESGLVEFLAPAPAAGPPPAATGH